MKKTILTLAAIFIATQLFSQDVEKITINYNQTQNHQCIGFFPVELLLKLGGEELSSKREEIYEVFDIKNMKIYFRSNLQKEIIRDIVKFETLEDGTLHIVIDERNILYPEEDNIRILTHHYVNPDKNLSVYYFQWMESLGFSVAIKAINPKIVLN